MLGEGWHRALGRDHAEVERLLPVAPAGATLYVTLEPCTQAARRRAPTRSWPASALRRPRGDDPRVNGRGLRRLRSAGVRVERGLLAREADEQLAGYRRAHLAGLPRVTSKVAATLDGRIADAHGRSRWITGAAARADGHRLRAEHDAIVVGAGTARSDDPRLTARTGARVRQPLRVIVDSKLRLNSGLRVFSRALAAGTVVACTREAPWSRERALLDRGVRVWRLAATGDRVSPLALARRLVAEGCHDVLLEGGATLGASWLRSRLVQRVVLYGAPSCSAAAGAGATGRPARRRCVGASCRPRGRRHAHARGTGGLTCSPDWSRNWGSCSRPSHVPRGGDSGSARCV